ncbi:MAG TPA: cytochrome c3 family protein, partial [Nitrospirota bacterium]
MTTHTRNFMLICVTLILPLVGFKAAEGAQSTGCLRCHGNSAITDKGKGFLYIDPVKFAGTTHALIGCTSCHDSVSRTHPTDGVRPSRAACSECHANIKEEYAKSLHGQNAGCADCHNPHVAKAFTAVSGHDINAQCAKCHETARTVASHGKWLPQADLHIDAIP